MPLDPETIQTLIDKLINMAMEFGPKLFTATVILVIGFFAGRWLGGVLNGWLNKLEMEPPASWCWRCL
jgi:hypothetical protein